MDLEQVKSYLRVDGFSSDADISALMIASASYIKRMTGKTKVMVDGSIRKIEEDETYNLACKIIIAHWFENRGVEVPGALNKITHSIDSLVTHIALCSDYINDNPVNPPIPPIPPTPQELKVTLVAGLTDKYTVGVGGVIAGQVLFVLQDMTVQAANSANVTHADKVVGICLASKSAGDQVQVQKTGTIECIIWNLTPGKVYFLSSGGEITNVVPKTGFVQKIGVAETATKLVLQIENAVILKQGR